MIIMTFKTLLLVIWATVATALEQSLALLTDEQLDRMVTTLHISIEPT